MLRAATIEIDPAAKAITATFARGTAIICLSPADAKVVLDAIARIAPHVSSSDNGKVGINNLYQGLPRRSHGKWGRCMRWWRGDNWQFGKDRDLSKMLQSTYCCRSCLCLLLQCAFPKVAIQIEHIKQTGNSHHVVRKLIFVECASKEL